MSLRKVSRREMLKGIGFALHPPWWHLVRLQPLRQHQINHLLNSHNRTHSPRLKK